MIADSDLRHLSAAMRLVLACLPWPIDTTVAARIRATASEVGDWEEVFALTARHRVTALVDHALRSAAVIPPDPIAARLAAQAAASAFTELACAREAAVLCAALRERRIEPLLLKGAATALTCYARFGLKASRDIDLLVREDQVEESLAVLEAMGFVSDPDDRPRDPTWRRRYKDTEMVRPGSPLLVELHWRPFDNDALDPRLSNDQRRTIRLYPGAEVAVLAPDASFAYLCLHGAQHAWSRLKWLAEVDAFISGVDEADRPRLYANAAGRQAGFAVAQALVLRAHLFGKAAPIEVERRYVSSRRLRWLVALALRSILAGGSEELEQQPLGSTPKNISHYLLFGSPSYWFKEIIFDVRDDRTMIRSGTARRFGTIGRVVSWLWRVPAALHRIRTINLVKSRAARN